MTVASAWQAPRGTFNKPSLQQLAIGVAGGDEASAWMEDALAFVAENLGADHSSIITADGSGAIRCLASRGLSAATIQAIECLPGSSAFTFAHAPWIVPDVTAETVISSLAPALSRDGAVSAAFVPVALRAKVLGQIALYFDHKRVLDDGELQTVRSVSALVALAIGNRDGHDRDQRFRRLIETLGVAVYTTDAEGTINFYNEEAAILWGRRPQLGIDRWCGSFKLFWPDGRLMEFDQCPMATAVREGKPVRGIEAIAERPDGTRITFAPFPTPIFDSAGERIGAVNVLVDVTTRCDAEEALKLNEATLVAALTEKEDVLANRDETIRLYEAVQAHLASLVEACGALISTGTPEEAVRSILQVAVDLLRADAFAIWRPEGKAGWRIVSSKGLGEGYLREPQVQELFRLRDGARVITVGDVLTEAMSASARAWHAREGVRSFLVTPLAIGDERQGTLALFYRQPHAFSDLELRVGFALAGIVSASLTVSSLFEANERARIELQQTNGTLTQVALDLSIANAAKDEFLSLVSHELKTPLTTIRGNATILFRDGDSVDPGSARLALGDIVAESERLHRIIENLLMLARAEKGQVLEAEPLIVSRVVQRVLQRHHQQRPDRAFQIHDRGDPRPVVFSEVFLEQIIENLISNAEKYSPPDQPIAIEFERDAREVTVRVLDRGPGIQAEDADHVFDAFYRASEVKRRAEGLGIGLAVCKRLVEAQGGRVWAKQRADGGSEFGFALPILDDDGPGE